jgi:hypothetical protein
MANIRHEKDKIVITWDSFEQMCEEWEMPEQVDAELRRKDRLDEKIWGY